MLTRGVTKHIGFDASSEMWLLLQRLLDETAGKRLLAVAYWGAIDAVSHMHGPSDRAFDAEVRSFCFALQREFLAGLSRPAAGRTLLLLLADHGQQDVRPEAALALDDHPALMDQLVLPPGGEPRAAYFYVRNGRASAVRSYLEQQAGAKLAVVSGEAAFEGQLFGPGTPHPRAGDRVGDLIALAQGPSYVRFPQDEGRTLGRHGALAPEEMLVPLIWTRLDRT